ncbi:hypothetical protein RHGRI_020910 [Rhododendron griersonianum]|uniref:Tripeptidyl peptidase II second Ig-like domain-containing protein n=1 Tax=Rhododendron griersonianum TaxID=479676 RepID=A0AAV6JP52_9ERIC|nr:hypothetical protein RHGRI_020910 [Rhododendron griersonianum]
MYCLIGHIEREFIEVPIGASWVEASMQTSGFNTARGFYIYTVQGGCVMELAIAQFWSSGIGSQGTTVVDFERKSYLMEVKHAKALLCSEKLALAAILNKIRASYRPIDSKLSTLSKDPDKLPSGKQTLALTLTYKFKLDDGAEVKPQIPLLNNCI